MDARDSVATGILAVQHQCLVRRGCTPTLAGHGGRGRIRRGGSGVGARPAAIATTERPPAGWLRAAGSREPGGHGRRACPERLRGIGSQLHGKYLHDDRRLGARGRRTRGDSRHRRCRADLGHDFARSLGDVLDGYRLRGIRDGVLVGCRSLPMGRYRRAALRRSAGGVGSRDRHPTVTGLAGVRTGSSGGCDTGMHCHGYETIPIGRCLAPRDSRSASSQSPVGDQISSTEAARANCRDAYASSMESESGDRRAAVARLKASGVRLAAILRAGRRRAVIVSCEGRGVR